VARSQGESGASLAWRRRSELGQSNAAATLTDAASGPWSGREVAVMLPVYNERENLRPIVSGILESLPGVSVVIVEDMSTDGSAELADQLQAEHPGQVTVLHRQARGRASAGIAGFRHILEHTSVRYIVEMDADFSHHPRHLPALVRAAQSCDVAVGSRLVRGAKDARPPLRRWVSRCANIYARLLFGGAVRDWSGGFKCYRREALAALDFDSIWSKGFTIGAELLWKLHRLEFRFVEVPITFEDRRLGASKFSAKDMWRGFDLLLRLRLGRGGRLRRGVGGRGGVRS